MKTLLLVAALLFVASAKAQTFVTTLVFIGTNPVYADDGTLKSAPIQGMFKQTAEVGGKTVEVAPAPNVTWDGTDKTRTITVDGITLTYEQVTRAAGAIANKELAGGAGTQKKAAADAAAAAATPKPNP